MTILNYQEEKFLYGNLYILQLGSMKNDINTGTTQRYEQFLKNYNIKWLV